MRVSDWVERYHDHIRAAWLKKWRPGDHDCASFARGNVKALLGYDVANALRSYNGLADGKNALLELGFNDHIEMTSSLFPTIQLHEAMMGDLASVLAVNDELALAVVNGATILSAAMPVGLSVHPLQSAQQIFAVR